MNERIERVKEEIENFLKNSVDHQNKHIDYILVDPDTNETYVLASDGYDEAIEFTPLSKNYEEGYTNVPEWDYNFDYYIYNLLEEGKQIAYMSDDVHYGIWNSIHELYPEDIDYKDGVQWYLQYCADKGITKEYLDEKTSNDTPDIMKHFEGLAMFDTMEYKGYIIEADDINFDNPKENLVNIYENKQDYENKECIETVSLNTVGLKQNIRDYIDEFYVDKTEVIKKADLPTHITIFRNDFLKYDSMILLEQLRTIDKSRLISYLGKLKDNQLQKIDNALIKTLSINIIGYLFSLGIGEYNEKKNERIYSDYYFKETKTRDSIKSNKQKRSKRNGH